MNGSKQLNPNYWVPYVCKELNNNHIIGFYSNFMYDLRKREIAREYE